MKVVFLGTGTGVPVPTRGYAGIYVRAGREHVLLDAGPGTLRQLSRLGVTFLTLDRLFLTHFHPDHCLDLVSILFAMRLPAATIPSHPLYAAQAGIPQPAVGSPSAADTSSAARTVPPRSRTTPFTIYGPRGLTQLYRKLNTAFHGWIAPRTYRLILKEIGETTLKLPGYIVRTKRMNHAGGQALGYRFEARGKSVVYSGDTDLCPAIVELGRAADLLILECSVTDERKVSGHLTPTECGRIAAQAGCKQLALTHFYPVFKGYDIRRRVRRAFRGPLVLARDCHRRII